MQQDHLMEAINFIGSINYCHSEETDEVLRLANAHAAIAYAQAMQRIATALERLSTCVILLNNGEVALNVYDVSRQDV